MSSILVREGPTPTSGIRTLVAFAHRAAKPRDTPFALKGQASQSFKDPICAPALSRASSWQRPVGAQHMRLRPGLQQGGAWYPATSPSQDSDRPRRTPASRSLDLLIWSGLVTVLTARRLDFASRGRATRRRDSGTARDGSHTSTLRLSAPALSGPSAEREAAAFDAWSSP